MSAEEIRVGQIESTRIQVKKLDVKTVKIRDEVHAKTNHYIKQSRPYFPNTKLRIYIDCPCFLILARLVCFVTLFGFLGAIGAAPKELPLGFLIACAIFLLIYCQHEWVNQGSLTVVLRQPVFDGQRNPNWFYELTVTELKGVALENYQAGVGFVKLTQGKIKFQAFNRNAIKRMSSAECHSRLMLFFFLLSSALNTFYVVEGYSKY